MALGAIFLKKPAVLHLITDGFPINRATYGAGAGDWIYEPNGAEHEATHHPEETLYLANVHGAIAFYGEDKQIVGISDWRGMKALMDQQGGG